MREMRWYFRDWWRLNGGALAANAPSAFRLLHSFFAYLMLVETQNVADRPDSESHSPRSMRRSRLLAKRLHKEVTSVAKFLVLAAQLFLLAVVIYRYNLESPAFVQLIELTFAGFVVHHFLPMAYRLPFFMALSLAGIVMVFGLSDAA